jgi:hypothetical protein
MVIYTVQFNYPRRSNYSKLLDVFRHSVKLTMPKVKFIEKKIPAPVNNSKRQLNFMYNGVKLRLWVEFLEKTKENVIFADCDMMALQSAEHAFDNDFDVAYTERTRIKRIPMNGGIMMARPTEAAKKFYREMLEVNDRMFKDLDFHHKWRCVYAGMNQAAFGYTLNNGNHGAKIHKYKTIEWNAVDCDWTHLNEKTVFLHTKSKLRKSVLGEIKVKPELKHPVNLWKSMYMDMMKK